MVIGGEISCNKLYLCTAVWPSHGDHGMNQKSNENVGVSPSGPAKRDQSCQVPLGQAAKSPPRCFCPSWDILGPGTEIWWPEAAVSWCCISGLERFHFLLGNIPTCQLSLRVKGVNTGSAAGFADLGQIQASPWQNLGRQSRLLGFWKQPKAPMETAAWEGLHPPVCLHLSQGPAFETTKTTTESKYR